MGLPKLAKVIADKRSSSLEINTGKISERAPSELSGVSALLTPGLLDTKPKKSRNGRRNKLNELNTLIDQNFYDEKEMKV